MGNIERIGNVIWAVCMCSNARGQGFATTITSTFCYIFTVSLTSVLCVLVGSVGDGTQGPIHSSTESHLQLPFNFISEIGFHYVDLTGLELAM